MLVSVLTMTVGNVAALTQTNMKRLLAYSSIAHAGYIMMGVVALSENGARAMMIYLLAYLFMNLGAFLVVTLVHNQDGTFDLRDYPGLYRRAPFLTVAMAVFLLSLMGIPPLVGFMGKLYVFAAIIERGPAYYWYAVVGAVNAAIAAYLLRARPEDDDHRRRQRGQARPSACPPSTPRGWRCCSPPTSCPCCGGAGSRAGRGSRSASSPATSPRAARANIRPSAEGVMSESRGGVGRRVFLRAAGAGAAAVAASRLSVGLASAAEVDVVEATLADLQQRMAAGQLTARR